MTAPLEAFGRRMNRIRRSVLGFGSALLGLVAGGGVAFGIKRAASDIDRLAKTADKLGVSTERLAGLRHAARLTGVETTQLDTAMQRMTRRVSEAARGGGVASKSLRELGLDARHLVGLSPDEMIRRIADAMRGVSSQSDRVRIAFSLFDTEGVGLVNTLAGGAAALDAFQEDAERLGLTVSRVDAAAVERANDAFSRLGGLITGVFRELAVTTAPFIEELVTGFVNWASEGEGAVGLVHNAIDGLFDVVGFLADQVHNARFAWRSFQVAAAEAIASIARKFASLSTGLDNFTTIVGLIADIDIPKLSGLATTFELVAESAARTARENMEDLLYAPLPSTLIDKWVAGVRERSKSAFKGGVPGIGDFDPTALGRGAGDLKTIAAVAIRTPVSVNPAQRRAQAALPKIERNTAQQLTSTQRLETIGQSLLDNFSRFGIEVAQF